jgi:hypothetical protein
MNNLVLVVLKTDSETVSDTVPTIDNGSYFIVPYDCEDILKEALIRYRVYYLTEIK